MVIQLGTAASKTLLASHLSPRPSAFAVLAVAFLGISWAFGADHGASAELSTDQRVSIYVKQLTDLGARDEAREEAAMRLEQIGPQANAAVPALIAVVKDPDANLRADALAALAEIDPVTAVPILIEAASRDKHGTPRRMALAKLKKLGQTSAAVPSFIDALQDQDGDIRYGAVEALGAIGPDASAAVPALIRELKDPFRNNSYEAADALKSMGPEVAVPALIGALRDDDSVMRARAAMALSTVGPQAKAALPALVQALKDDDYGVCDSAAEAVAYISKDPSLSVARSRLTAPELQRVIVNLEKARAAQSAPLPQRDAILAALQDEVKFRQSGPLDTARLLLVRYRLMAFAVAGSLAALFLWLIIRSRRPHWLSWVTDRLARLVRSPSTKKNALVILINSAATLGGVLASRDRDFAALYVAASIFSAVVIARKLLRGIPLGDARLPDGQRARVYGGLVGMALCSLAFAGFGDLVTGALLLLPVILMPEIRIPFPELSSVTLGLALFTLVFLLVDALGAVVGRLVGSTIGKLFRRIEG